MLLSRNFLERSGWNLWVNISQIRSKTTQKSSKNPTKNPEKWPQKWDPLYTKLLNTTLTFFWTRWGVWNLPTQAAPKVRLATCILQAVKGIPLGFLEGPETVVSPRKPDGQEVPGFPQVEKRLLRADPKPIIVEKWFPESTSKFYNMMFSLCFFWGVRAAINPGRCKLDALLR